MTETDHICDHCHKPIGPSIIWDHGNKYHPGCFEAAVEAEAKIQKEIKKDWSEGLYES